MNILIIMLLILIILPFFLLTVWALLDVAAKQFPGETREKLVWWLVATIPFIGWFIYLATGRRRGKKKLIPA